YDPKQPEIFNFGTNYGKQSVFIITALILGLAILIIEAKFFGTAAPFLYGITIILLIIVLIIGKNVGGNQAWIPIGSFRLQPSEFAKWSSGLLLARYLSSANVKLTEIQPLLICGAILGLHMLLIMLQPDTGSSMVFVALIFVLYREVLSPNFLILGGLMIILFITTLLLGKFYVIAGLVLILILLVYKFQKQRKFITSMILGFFFSIIMVFSVD